MTFGGSFTVLGTLLILVWVSVWFTPTPITFGHFLNNLIYYNHWQEITQQSTPHSTMLDLLSKY